MLKCNFLKRMIAMQQRELPKKTKIYMIILVMLGIIFFFLMEQGKAAKATKILYQLGYKNVTDVKVFSKVEILNEDTNVKGLKYALKFKDLDQNKQCRGFIARDYKNNIYQDVECK
jgi:hypothetical protein